MDQDSSHSIQTGTGPVFLAGDNWGRRYGRPVRLGNNPARPKTRINEAGADACRLTGHLAASYPDLLHGPQVDALRQVMVQNYYRDAAGRLRWRDDDSGSGLPPPATRIVSPCDLAARYARRGQVTRRPDTSPTLPGPAPPTALTSSPTSPPCCARTFSMMMAASLAVRTWVRGKAPPGVSWRGLGVRGGGLVVSLR
jgi:hypothetical protein